MTRWEQGQDVLVEIDGREHVGEVIRQSGGYVMCTILTDPEWDYSGPVAPEQTVCVPVARLRPPAAGGS